MQETVTGHGVRGIALAWQAFAACLSEDPDLFFPWDDEDQDWQDLALCAETDPELFFPEKGGSVREAKAVCRRCPVRPECLEYALANDIRHGIWGGLSWPQRRELKRQAAA